MNIRDKNKMPLLLDQIYAMLLKEREFINGRWHYLNHYEILDAILSLKQEAPCPLCKGESRKLIHGDKIEIRGCTLCKGAGFMPLLAVLDSDQSYEIDEGLHPDSKIAVKDMIAQGWRKVVIE